MVRRSPEVEVRAQRTLETGSAADRPRPLIAAARSSACPRSVRSYSTSRPRRVDDNSPARCSAVRCSLTVPLESRSRRARRVVVLGASGSSGSPPATDPGPGRGRAPRGHRRTPRAAPPRARRRLTTSGDVSGSATRQKPAEDRRHEPHARTPPTGARGAPASAAAAGPRGRLSRLCSPVSVDPTPSEASARER